MKKKLFKFLEVLEDYGEYFFSNGSIKKDYEYIKGILDVQGFWSATRYRFYFDNDFNLVNVEERF